MEVLLEQLINGLTLGALYASVAIGLALIFGVVRQINFAHGEWFMVASYAFYFLFSELDLPYPIALILGAGVMVIFGILFERIVVRPFTERSWYVQLITTLAASIVLANTAILLFTATPRNTPTPYLSTLVSVGSFQISLQRILVLVVSVISFVALDQFLNKTKLGKAMRAMSQNREACAVVGIEVKKISTVTFAASAALVALGAGLVDPLYNIEPTMGTVLILKAFAAVIMGGFGQVKGAIYSAFILGIAEALAAGYLSSEYKDAIAFILIIAVLILRPQGLFGRKVGL